MSALETLAAVLATAAGLAAITLDQLSSNDSDGTVLAGIAGAVTVGIAVLLFASVVPAAKARSTPNRREAETALVTSVIGFLSVASAWTGLPFVLGTGGAMLGTTARRSAARSQQRGLAGLAIALGVGAVALGSLAVAVL